MLKSAGSAHLPLIKDKDKTPEQDVLHFVNGLSDYLQSLADGKPTVTEEMFTGKVERKDDGGHGNVEWAVLWGAAGFGDADGFVHSYCNTIPTAEGGTHEAGLRASLTRGLKAYADLAGNKKASNITAEDVMGTSGSAALSVCAQSGISGADQRQTRHGGSAKADRSGNPPGLRSLARLQPETGAGAA